MTEGSRYWSLNPIQKWSTLMYERLEELLALIFASTVCLYFFLYPEKYNRFIEWIFRKGKELPVISTYWKVKYTEEWVARPKFIRYYFLFCILIMCWILVALVAGK